MLHAHVIHASFIPSIEDNKTIKAYVLYCNLGILEDDVVLVVWQGIKLDYLLYDGMYMKLGKTTKRCHAKSLM